MIKWLIRTPKSAPELRTFGAFYRKMRHFLQNLTCQAFRYICYKLCFSFHEKILNIMETTDVFLSGCEIPGDVYFQNCHYYEELTS